ncbi:MAG TPA: periplasmic heavy metal sensor [Acidobacteriaceae bacterium]|jgi:Spy/CpxP family protein refolding chaperone|nr:periplasmic heavy metal sensor [Acidobacteriaceae bacterium]
MKQLLKSRAIHWTATAALLFGGLPLMAQQWAANAPPLPPLPPLQSPDMGGGMGPGSADRGPMAPHRPPMERAFRMGPRGRWWDNPEIAQKLGLSADQQKKMDDIFLQSRLKLIDEHASVEKEEAILEPLLSAEQPNESRILAQIDKVAQSRAELEKANARMLLGLRGVLTTAQWKTLQTLGSERRDRFERREQDGRRGPSGQRTPDDSGAPPPPSGAAPAPKASPGGAPGSGDSQ